MPTLVLDAYSKAYPFITNRIRASVFLESSPLAPVATIIDSTPGHPQRIWHFPGLQRNNYGFSLDEINGSDIVVANLALFDVVPSQYDGLLTRNDEQIQVGHTPGFNVGDNTFTFDGTGGKPDYRGWEIVPSELTGRGILVRDELDYTWDAETGVFTLQQAGDVFAVDNFYNIHFNPIQEPFGNSYPTLRDFRINIVNTDIELDNTYFGDKLIVEPFDNYMEVTLPDINTVVEGRAMMVEIGGNILSCVRFKTQLGQTLNFLRGNLYSYPNESFSIYKLVRPDTSMEYRVSEADGNFKNVGQMTDEDFTSEDVINKQLLDGSSKDKFQYARIFNEVVLNLPIGQVVNYDDWATGNNKYLYSLANSADIGNVNKFHFPDRRGLFERTNNVGKAGDFQDQDTKADYIDTEGEHGTGVSTLDTYSAGIFHFKQTPRTLGTETRPVNYFKNKYVLI